MMFAARLIVAGALEGGSAVEIGPLPFEFLDTAPLFDSQWIDLHLVELAELGARLEERGYEFHAHDDHWLQPQRICRRAGQGFVDADDVEIVHLREEAKAALAKFAGRSREINGRKYLHIDDYRSWQDRKVEGNLTILDGVSASSWNRWTDAHGGEGVAELVGIRLGKVDGHPNSSQPADTGDNAHASLLECQPLVTKARAVRNHAMALLENLFALRITIATISKSNFASHPVLFKKQGARMDELIDIADNLAEQYHKILDVVDPGSGGGTGRFKVDIARTRQRAQNASETIVASLIFRAKLGALLDHGATKSLAEMMLAELKGDPA